MATAPGPEFTCPTCRSKGFGPSVLGGDRCTFCDGTEGGNPPEYTCAACHGTFTKTWSDREAQEELWRYLTASLTGSDMFGEIPIDWPWLRAFVDEHCVPVCDDCYPKILEVNAGRSPFHD